MWVNDIANMVTNYFENIFTTGTCDWMEECLNAVPHKMTSKMQDVLSRDFTAEEIKAALFQMGPTKVPGLHVMNALFFQKFWHIVSDDVIVVVLYFLNSGNKVLDINYTHIVLIPKIKTRSAFVS